MKIKVPSKVEKAATVLDKIYRGCGWLLVNIWGWRAWKRGEEMIDLP